MDPRRSRMKGMEEEEEEEEVEEEEEEEEELEVLKDNEGLGRSFSMGVGGTDDSSAPR